MAFVLMAPRKLSDDLLILVCFITNENHDLPGLTHRHFCNDLEISEISCNLEILKTFDFIS